MIQIRTQHLTSDEAKAATMHVIAGDTSKPHVEAHGEFDDAVAVTIASMYQAPGGPGSVLASLASGAPVEYQELSDDIAAVGREHNWPTRLECLATWLINRD